MIGLQKGEVTEGQEAWWVEKRSKQKIGGIAIPARDPE